MFISFEIGRSPGPRKTQKPPSAWDGSARSRGTTQFPPTPCKHTGLVPAEPIGSPLTPEPRRPLTAPRPNTAARLESDSSRTIFRRRRAPVPSCSGSLWQTAQSYLSLRRKDASYAIGPNIPNSEPECQAVTACCPSRKTAIRPSEGRDRCRRGETDGICRFS